MSSKRGTNADWLSVFSTIQINVSSRHEFMFGCENNCASHFDFYLLVPFVYTAPTPSVSHKFKEAPSSSIARQKFMCCRKARTSPKILLHPGQG